MGILTDDEIEEYRRELEEPMDDCQHDNTLGSILLACIIVAAILIVVSVIV